VDLPVKHQTFAGLLLSFSLLSLTPLSTRSSASILESHAHILTYNHQLLHRTKFCLHLFSFFFFFW